MRNLLYYGFVLPDGTELAMNDTVRLHEQLALEYIKANGLYAKFRKSSCEDPTDFMVIEVGAIKVGNFASATSITVATPYYSDYIKELVEEYGRRGYKIDRFHRRY